MAAVMTEEPKKKMAKTVKKPVSQENDLISQYTKEHRRQKKTLENPIGSGLAFLLGKNK